MGTALLLTFVAVELVSKGHIANKVILFKNFHHFVQLFNFKVSDHEIF